MFEEEEMFFEHIKKIISKELKNNYNLFKEIIEFLDQKIKVSSQYLKEDLKILQI